MERLEYLDPNLIDNDANVHAGMIGRTRTGKTTQLIERANKAKMMIGFDTQGDFTNHEAPLYLTNAVIVGSAQQIINKFKKGQFRVVYIPPDDHIKYFDKVARTVYRLAEALHEVAPELSITFAVDEIWVYANKDVITFPLKKIIRAGLKKNLRLLMTQQRLADCHADVTTQMTHIYVYNSMAQDIKYLNRFYPVINEGAMRQLSQYECLYYDCDMRQLWKLPPVDIAEPIRT